ncbi:Peptidoglycan hydrolase FlgJ [Aquicella siphonis]|uniref:Peptidoglycan hydrolase FlgJ n=1 Tax=Aquicella siphonis TaxID=254247 RepID=A0A5E4PL07_9COXI|nr:flagellar assembly peptidoglycan hydrolase FlgJ [Aquicella siphonis]VVC77087.1 Peptidoglycan hydrolase FlgJ [Aquicella siphonis]
MIDKIANDARVYTDIQSLERLRYASNKNPDMAKKEVAQQFESMMMQIVLRSMRDANKAFSSGLLDNDQMDFYQDMLDKQLSMLTSGNGTGFAQMVETNINQQYKAQQPAADLIANQRAEAAMHENIHVKPLFDIDRTSNNPGSATIVSKYEKLPPASHKQTPFNSQDEFVKTLWSAAKSAAKSIGVDPKILLAQAALETNWGKKILPGNHEQSSFNLFNIKADPSWNKQTTLMSTLEQKDGILTREKAAFRSYDSFIDSFHDYVQFLKQNSRYSDALNKASDPHRFIQALQEAGFATDKNYADKILKIFSSHTFKAIVAKLE